MKTTLIVKSAEFKEEQARAIATLERKIAEMRARDDLSENVRNSIISDYAREISSCEEAMQDEIIEVPDNGYEVEEW